MYYNSAVIHLGVHRFSNACRLFVHSFTHSSKIHLLTHPTTTPFITHSISPIRLSHIINESFIPSLPHSFYLFILFISHQQPLLSILTLTSIEGCFITN